MGLVFHGRTILLALNLARPRPAAPPGAPTRTTRGMSGFWIRQVYIGFRLFLFLERRSGDVFSILVPGHALHEEGLQRQIGVGTLVSIQERRALFVPLIKRWSTAAFVPPSVSSTN